MTSPTDRPREQALLFVVSAMAGAVLLMGPVLLVLGAELVSPPLWMLLVVVVATAGAWAATLLLPAPAGLRDGDIDSVVHTLTLVRAALLEAPAMLALALAFVATPVNLTIYLVAALFALAGLWLFARPSAVRAQIERGRPPGQPRSSL